MHGVASIMPELTRLVLTPNPVSQKAWQSQTLRQVFLLERHAALTAAFGRKLQQLDIGGAAASCWEHDN